MSELLGGKMILANTSRRSPPSEKFKPVEKKILSIFS